MEEAIKEKLTRGEFRKLCADENGDLNYQTLAHHIREGNVIEVDRLIDITNEVNKQFIQERQNLLSQKQTATIRKIDTEKKEVELNKAKEELRIKKLTRQKLEAELIPTDLVFVALNGHFKFMRQQFFYAAEQIARDTVRKMGGGQAEEMEVKTNLIKLVNDLVDKSNKQSAEEIKNIVQDFKSLFGK